MSKLKEIIYFLNDKKFLFCVGVIFILFALSEYAKADDSIYFVSKNIVGKDNDYKIIINDNITSNILVDNFNIYFYSDKNFYIANKTNGNINFKLKIPGIKEQKQTNNYTYLKTVNQIYKINKNNGIIEQKQIFNTILHEIYNDIDDIPLPYDYYIVGYGNKSISYTKSKKILLEDESTIVIQNTINNNSFVFFSGYFLVDSIKINNINNAIIDFGGANFEIGSNNNFSIFDFNFTNNTIIKNGYFNLSKNITWDKQIEGGLSFSNSYYNFVENNRIILYDNRLFDDNNQTGTGIMFDDTSFNNYANNNYIYGGRNGIYSYNSNIISNNQITANAHLCIFLRKGRFNIITSNNCYNSNAGIGVQGSDVAYNAYSNTITGNSIVNMGGGSGITLDRSQSNVVSGNMLESMQYAGILITSSSNNTVVGNTIKNCQKTSTVFGCIVIQNVTGNFNYSNENVVGLNNVITTNKSAFQSYGIKINYQTQNNKNYVFLNNVMNGSVNYYSGFDTNQNYMFLDKDFSYIKTDLKPSSASMTGAGNGFVCVNSNGGFYRSVTACV